VQKLLLADDSITIQKVVELILAEEGFEIKSVNSGQEALDAIESFQPDIILADVDMPNMNGYQLSERIKTNEATKHFPVILLTGAFEPVDHELIQQVQADDFLVKPFESQDLISKINATLTASTVSPIEEESIAETEEVVAEEGSVEEDLWSLEEIPETAEMEGWAEEAIDAGTEQIMEAEEAVDAGIEQIMEAEETVHFEADEVKEDIAGMPDEPLEAMPQATETAMPRMDVSEVSIPSVDTVKNIIEHAINEKISAAVSSDNVQKALIASLDPHIKDILEKVLWEVAPDLIEKTVKEMLSGSLESLSQQVEKVIWETVPDLAETMITKEIERIRSEF
jgi:CheY-like chemotaxis protein